MRVDLPGGGWAELREAKDLRVKDKVAVQRAIRWNQGPISDDDEATTIPVDAGLSDDLQMAMLGRVIVSWSLDGTSMMPVPATDDMLGDLEVDTYEALTSAIEDHMKIIRSRPNRKTPTGSSGSSRASQSRNSRRG